LVSYDIYHAVGKGLKAAAGAADPPVSAGNTDQQKTTGCMDRMSFFILYGPVQPYYAGGRALYSKTPPLYVRCHAPVPQQTL
jgi:hypothetical protein